MAAGFEVDPDRLDGMGALFRQVSQDLNDLGRLSSSAGAVDLHGTPGGAAFAHAWDQLSRAYRNLAREAATIGLKLNENARQYRETEGSTSTYLDRARPARNQNLE